MRTNIVLFLVFLLLSFSCSPETFYFEEVSKIDNNWSKDDKRFFSVPVKDSTKKYTLYFILRNNSQYPYSNIYFFTTLQSPNGDIVTDTLEYQLAYPNGKWIGSGMGDVKQNTLVYKENIPLKEKGIYKVSVAQAMRNSNLNGIEDISLLVEKSN